MPQNPVCHILLITPLSIHNNILLNNEIYYSVLKSTWQFVKNILPRFKYLVLRMLEKLFQVACAHIFNFTDFWREGLILFVLAFSHPKSLPMKKLKGRLPHNTFPWALTKIRKTRKITEMMLWKSRMVDSFIFQALETFTSPSIFILDFTLQNIRTMSR